MIEYYKFEITPWIYGGTHGGQEKLLEVNIKVNGEEHTTQRIISSQRPFETEVEYYTRMATSTLHDLLKDLSEKD